MLDILPLATLQLYERHIEHLVKLYPAAWHLVVLADEKARGENWARIRLRVSADIAAGKSPPDLWDSRRPWVASMHMLVGDTAFWEDQVRSPANAWMAAGGRGVAKSPRRLQQLRLRQPEPRRATLQETPAICRKTTGPLQLVGHLQVREGLCPPEGCWC